MKQANALTFEQAKQLLPVSFLNIVPVVGSRIRNLYSTSMGNLYFSASKDYNSYNTNWWYSFNPHIIIDNDIRFICLAADSRGIFLIPSAPFMEYRDKNSVGCLKNEREKITIKEYSGRFIRKESKCEEWDITKYFIPVKR